jgi:hypothetical protein
MGRDYARTGNDLQLSRRYNFMMKLRGNLGERPEREKKSR